MKDALLTIFISFGTAIASGFAGFMFGKRRYNADVTKSEIENIDLNFDTWQKIVSNLENRIETLMTKLNGMMNENLKLQEQLMSSCRELSELREENRKLKMQLENYEKNILANNTINTIK